MARSTSSAAKARKSKKQKFGRAGLLGATNAGISKLPLTRPEGPFPSKPMRPKYNKKSRSREPSAEVVEMSTPQMRALEPGLGILAYKGVDGGGYDASASSVSSSVASSVSSSVSSSAREAPGERIPLEASDAADFISLDFDNEPSNPSSKLAEQFEQYETENVEHHQLQPIGEFPAPWLDSPMEPKQTVGEQISAEVLEYLRYVSPSIDETRKRNDCIRRLRQVTKFLWPGCTLEVFGSYAMGLYLPDADIDVVISTAGSVRPIKLKSEMYRLSARMKKAQLADRVEVIAKARVPIVKYVDKTTGLSVDIAFDQTSGFDGVESVSSWMAEQPALKPLVLIIKQFLKRRKLNEVVSGGLGGYAVICLTYALLRSHKDFAQKPKLALENVGLLLIAFFELYGYQFDYRHYAVSVRHDSGKILKSANPDMETQKPNGLAIEDPNDSYNNISKSSFNFQSVERSFSLASDLLKRLSITWKDSPPSKRPQLSFLGPLLRYDKRTAVSRRKVDLKEALKPVLASTGPQQHRSQPQQSQLPPKPQVTRHDARGNDSNGSRSLRPPKTKLRRVSETALDLPVKRIDSRHTSDRVATTADSSVKPQRIVHDPFQDGSHTSSSDISDDEQPAKTAATHNSGSAPEVAGGKPNPEKDAPESRARGGDDDDDDERDSRTKLTSLERRQFWKRKGEVQVDSAASEL